MKKVTFSSEKENKNHVSKGCNKLLKPYHCISLFKRQINKSSLLPARLLKAEKGRKYLFFLLDDVSKHVLEQFIFSSITENVVITL